jgi:hypothetical protein
MPERPNRRPPHPDHNWLGVAAALACGLAAAATSPFRVVHPRSYPAWYLVNATKQLEKARLAAWISKSGKTGVGVTVMAERCGAEAPGLEVDKAELQVDGAESFVGKRAVEVKAAPPRKETPTERKEGAERRGGVGPAGPEARRKKGPAEPPPPNYARRFLYVPMPFDNERLWNDDLDKARLVLELKVEGKPFTWTVDAHHARQGYHRAVSFGAPPPCSVTPTHCTPPETEASPASAPASAPSSQPGSVLEKKEGQP